MDLAPHFRLILPVVRSRCIRQFFPDRRRCRVTWVIVPEVARWELPIRPLGPLPDVCGCLVSEDESLKCARRDVLCLPSLSHFLFCFPTFGV